jgi:ABC-2 type transport system permease protein
MRAYWTLTRRELGAYFLSLTGYIVIAASLFLTGLSFVALLYMLRGETTPMPVTEAYFNTWFFPFVVILGAPMITMRLFAQEKASGTFETLMTTPVSDLQVVLAKFSAALVFYIVLWLPLVGCVLLVRHYANDQTPFDAGVMGSTFLGIVLLGGVLLSLGCCASALTRSQVAAAMMGLAFGFSLLLLALLAQNKTNQSTWQAQMLACFALFEQLRDFARGMLDTRAVVLMVSLTLFFLFLNLRIVESRRWK